MRYFFYQNEPWDVHFPAPFFRGTARPSASVKDLMREKGFDILGSKKMNLFLKIS
jgi:hypothetical protein